mmetsp:Transcript_144659/g.351298  ORF Transcript_144659/g.351298 Transcript_144659/m.351298 type:complete len:271 (-) Transcript_144659:1062-1874(-)
MGNSGVLKDLVGNASGEWHAVRELRPCEAHLQGVGDGASRDRREELLQEDGPLRPAGHLLPLLMLVEALVILPLVHLPKAAPLEDLRYVQNSAVENPTDRVALEDIPAAGHLHPECDAEVEEVLVREAHGVGSLQAHLPVDVLAHVLGDLELTGHEPHDVGDDVALLNRHEQGDYLESLPEDREAHARGVLNPQVLVPMQRLSERVWHEGHHVAQILPHELHPRVLVQRVDEGRHLPRVDLHRLPVRLDAAEVTQDGVRQLQVQAALLAV